MVGDAATRAMREDGSNPEGDACREEPIELDMTISFV
jgi:hypothetical protein